MSTLLVSSKGQIVLPVAMRRRLGLGAGSRLEATLQADGVKLSVVRSVPRADPSALAGMVKAKPRGVPRNLLDFDPATTLRTRKREANPT